MDKRTLDRACNILRRVENGESVQPAVVAEARRVVAEAEKAEKDKKAEADKKAAQTGGKGAPEKAAQTGGKGTPEKDQGVLAASGDGKGQSNKPVEAAQGNGGNTSAVAPPPAGKAKPPPQGIGEGGAGDALFKVLGGIKDPAVLRSVVDLFGTFATISSNSVEKQKDREARAAEVDKTVGHASGWGGRVVSGFHATMDSKGRVRMRGGSVGHGRGGRGGSFSSGGGAWGGVDGYDDGGDGRLRLAPTRMGTHIGASRHPDENATYNLDWMPRDTMAKEDGSAPEFDVSDFYRHSDRRRSGRFQGGFLDPTFRDRFMSAYMNGVNPDDPNYERTAAMARAAYSRAMTRYSDEFQRYGKSRLQSQYKEWAKANPEEAAKRCWLVAWQSTGRCRTVRRR